MDSIKVLNMKREIRIKVSSFGSGEHETTLSCLKFMDYIDFNNKSVLDIGSGTGILSIYASILGAKKVVGYDISFDACSNFKENVAINYVKNCFVICSDERAIKGNYDIIIANIYFDIIINLKEYILKWMENKKGFLILSGIPIEENYEVRKIYCNQEFEVIKSFYGEEYTTFLMKKGG